jgi:hypothetical protein
MIPPAVMAVFGYWRRKRNKEKEEKKKKKD